MPHQGYARNMRRASSPCPTFALTLLLTSVLAATLTACPEAPVATRGTGPALARETFVGVFTTSTEGYAQAEAAADAVRFAADGTFQRGLWSASEGRFSPPPEPPRTRDWVDRWELDPATGVMRFLLDGAEEEVPVERDGPDRWRTIYDGADGHIEVFYVRVGNSPPR